MFHIWIIYSLRRTVQVQNRCSAIPRADLDLDQIDYEAFTQKRHTFGSVQFDTCICRE